MPRKPRTDEVETLYAEIWPWVKRWLERQAKANGRSTTSELQQHLVATLDPAHRPAEKARKRKADSV